jgi:hypothetical protein
MIPLFSRYALDRPQVEERLGRPLGGDPSRGERAALLALAVLDYDRCRQHLSEPGVGADFRALVEERLEQSIQRSGRHFVVATLVDGHAYDHYARQARLQGVQVGATIAAAVERDFATARGLHQVEAEPVLPALVGYLRDLIELLHKTDTDPDFAAKLAHLVDLHGRLTGALEAAATDKGGTP